MTWMSALKSTAKWDTVFKNGRSKIAKGCLPQILLGPFLNTLSQILMTKYVKFDEKDNILVDGHVQLKNSLMISNVFDEKNSPRNYKKIDIFSFTF